MFVAADPDDQGRYIADVTRDPHAVAETMQAMEAQRRRREFDEMWPQWKGRKRRGKGIRSDA